MVALSPLSSAAMLVPGAELRAGDAAGSQDARSPLPHRAGGHYLANTPLIPHQPCQLLDLPAAELRALQGSPVERVTHSDRECKRLMHFY